MFTHTAFFGARCRAASARHHLCSAGHSLPLRLALAITALCILVLTRGESAAATYYVDPQTGADSNSGSSPGAPWETVPGTRTVDNLAFLRSQWGAINQTNKIKCGDTILLKGGTTYSRTTVTNGGALRIDPFYYTDTCSAANPIAIRLANNAEWSGSTGNYTIDGTGITNTSRTFNPKNGPCPAGGVCAVVDIEMLDGIVMTGVSDTQRIVLTAVTTNPSSTAGVLVEGKGAGIGRDIQLGWFDITGKSTYDPGAAIAITDLGFSWVHDVSIHDWLGGGIDTRLETSTHRTQSLVLEKITVSGTGQRPPGTAQYPIADAFDIGGEYSDIRAGGGIWCLNCVAKNGYADGSNSGGCNGVNQDGIVRYRDSAFYGNGRNPALVLTQHGLEGSGDSVNCYQGTGNALPENTIVTIRSLFYNNYGAAIDMPHGSGSHYVWHATIFRGGETWEALGHNDCASSEAIFNSILDPGSKTAVPIGTVQCGSAENANHVVPVTGNTLVRGVSGTGQVSRFKSLCTTDNGTTWTTTPCTNGSCAAGQTCRTRYDLNNVRFEWNCNAPCTGESFNDPPGFLLGNGDIVGTQATNFVSTAGRCDTAFSDGAPGIADCDFHLQTTSPAIDPRTPLYVLLAKGAGTNASTITVKASTPEPEQMTDVGNYKSLGLAWRSRPHIADPRTYFISPGNHPWASGDVIQIVGTCTNGAGRHGAAGRARIVSMTSSTITLDDTCTWADGAGVHWPWAGSAPDMGAYEFGLDAQTIRAPVLLSVDPL